ncbi:tyrosine-type recombinase/integrase [Escherichia coli]
MRISELLDLVIQDLDLNEGRINIRRLKNGLPFTRYVLMSVKPWNTEPRNVLTGKALTGLTLYLFLAAGVGFLASRPIALFAMPGAEAGTVTQTHPHMLRHACGYKLAERGADTHLIQDYLGHRNLAILCVIPPVMLLVLPDYGKEIIS